MDTVSLLRDSILSNINTMTGIMTLTELWNSHFRLTMRSLASVAPLI